MAERPANSTHAQDALSNTSHSLPSSSRSPARPQSEPSISLQPRPSPPSVPPGDTPSTPPREKLPRARSNSKKASAGSPKPPRSSEMAAVSGCINPAEEITYTPTTHRISKAKKGKKVHYCEFGCGKVFTRAEHRKRHEANHRAEPLFRCEVEECQKPFQRSDLLIRHHERQHGIMTPNGMPGTGGARQRGSSISSSITASSQANSPIPGRANSVRGSSVGVSGTPAAGSMSIGSIIDSSRHGFVEHGQSWNESYHMPMSMAPNHFPVDLVFALPPSEELQLYSSDSCYSPVSDITQSHANTQPYLPQYDRPRATSVHYSSGYNTPAMQAPVTSNPGWNGYDDYSQSVEGLGIGYDVQFPVSARIREPASPAWNVIQGMGYEQEMPTPQAWTEIKSGW